VPVDLETLLQPQVVPADPPAARVRQLPLWRLYEESALRTGLLPIWHTGPDGSTYDFGGLTGTGGQATPFRALRWADVNTDAMAARAEPITMAERPNLPRCDGSARTAAPYVDDIVAGFARMYTVLLREREALLGPAGPLAPLAQQPVRFIVRPSSVYDAVLRRSLDVPYLRDGARRSVQLDVLSRGFLGPTKPPLWPALRREIRALEDLDIPVFVTDASSAGLELDGERLDDCFETSSFDLIRTRVAALGASDLERQLSIIRTSLGLRFAAEATRRHAATPDLDAVQPLDGPALLAHAVGIGEEIERLASHGGDGAARWATVEPRETGPPRGPAGR
jgi:lantibiotic modifying enzyme